MAKSKKNEIVVGITVFSVLALAVYVIVLLADMSKLTNEYQQITVQVPYTTGLQGLGEGSQIQLGGFKIGQIVDTDISTDDTGEIYVSFIMELPVQYKLYDDCILLPEQNILGAKAILSIKKLGGHGRELADGDTSIINLEDGVLEKIKKEFDVTNPDGILSTLKLELDRDNADSLMGSLVVSAANIREVTGSIKHEMEDSEQLDDTFLAKLMHVAENLEAVTDTIRIQLDKGNGDAILAKILSSLSKFDDSMSGLKGIVNDNKDNIDQAVLSLKNSAKLIETELPSIVEKLDQVMDKANSGLNTAKEALSELKSATTGANKIITVNHDRIDLMINNITEVSSNLKLVSQEVRRAPWRLLYKPNQKEMEIQSTVDTAAAFASGAERLDSAAIALKKAVSEMGDGLAPEKINKVLSELEMSFNQFHKAEEKLWEDLE